MTNTQSYVNIGAFSDDTPNYDELMTQYAPFVKRIAYHLMGRLPSSIQLDDMVQAGMIGLFESLKSFDMTRGASFETYSRIRIRGAMLDEVRICNWAPRSVHKKSRIISEAIREVEGREGRDAKDSEVADVLGVNMEQYYSMVKDAAGFHVLSYEDMTSTGGNKDEESISQMQGPYQELQEKDFKEMLIEKVSSLPDRERMVMALYYDEEFNLREIGEILGITEGRVCQIHGQALARLKSRMTEWVENYD